MVLDPIPQPLPVHFFGSRPQPLTSLDMCAFYLRDMHMCDSVTYKKRQVYIRKETYIHEKRPTTEIYLLREQIHVSGTFMCDIFMWGMTCLT